MPKLPSSRVALSFESSLLSTFLKGSSFAALPLSTKDVDIPYFVQKKPQIKKRYNREQKSTLIDSVEKACPLLFKIHTHIYDGHQCYALSVTHRKYFLLVIKPNDNPSHFPIISSGFSPVFFEKRVFHHRMFLQRSNWLPYSF